MEARKGELMCSAAMRGFFSDQKARREWETRRKRRMFWWDVRLLAKQAWQAMIQRLHHVLFSSEIEYAELQGGVLAILWGLWFTLPWYDTGTAYPVFQALLRVADNTLWATLFILIGAGQFAALLANSTRWRRVMAMGSCLIWAWVGLFLAYEDWHAMSCPCALAFAVGAALGYLKIHDAPTNCDGKPI